MVPFREPNLDLSVKIEQSIIDSTSRSAQMCIRIRLYQLYMGRNIFTVEYLVIYLGDLQTDCATHNECVSAPNNFNNESVILESIVCT